MKKLITCIIAVTLMLSGAGATYAATEQEHSELYQLVNAGTYNLFTNHVKGYSLFVDKGLSVDMSYSDVCASLESPEKTIEIYKQDIGSIGKTAYINYSNQFLSNTIDHYLEYSGHQTIGGREVSITAWSRDKLSRVANDKNHYVCIEIAEGRTVYTIFVKATAPIYELGGYNYLVENFKTSFPSKSPVMRVSSAVNLETRGWNDETKAFYNLYFSDDAELTWGIFEPDTAGFDYTSLHYYEEYFNYKFPIILNYSEFQNTYKHPNLKQRLDTAYSNGKTLELTLQTTPVYGGSNMVYDVLDGKYDVFLADYANVVAAFGHPVLFRLGNEMNGDWCPYSGHNTSKDTLIYKEFYKYIYKFFENAKAENVIWVWNPNGVSFPNFEWNNALMYYPGDEYVDIVGMTAYNTGTYYSSIGEKWTEFGELYDGLYNQYCALFKQPLMITEFASASEGGDKNQWVLNMFEDLDRYDRIKVVVWWDGCDWDSAGNVARSYILDESYELMDIFKKYFAPDWRKGAFG